MVNIAFDHLMLFQSDRFPLRFSQGFREICRTDYRISLAEWRVAAIIDIFDRAVSIGRVGDMAGSGAFKTQRAVSKLKKLGFLARSKSGWDGRTVVLALTPAGRQMIDELRPVMRKYENAYLAHIRSEESTFGGALDTLFAINVANH